MSNPSMPNDPIDRGRAVMDMVARTVAEHGRSIQGVAASDPISVPFTYTVGNHPDGPELIMFGLGMNVAGGLLNGISNTRADDLRAAMDAGGPTELLLTQPSDPDFSLRVRLTPVEQRWVRAYPHQARYFHDTDDVPFLHVEAADKSGRLPGEAGVDPKWEFASPILHGPRQGFRGAWQPDDDDVGTEVLTDEPDVLMLVPVCEDLPSGQPTVWTGAFEAVPAISTGRGTASPARVPMSTSTCLPGDTIEVRPHRPEDPWVRETYGLPVVVATARAGETGDVRVDLSVMARDDASFERVADRIDGWCDTDGITSLVWHQGGVSMTATPSAVGMVEESVRPLVRDGLMREGQSYGRYWAADIGT